MKVKKLYRLSSLTKHYSASAVEGCRGNLCERMPWTAPCLSQSMPAISKMDENNNPSKPQPVRGVQATFAQTYFGKGQETREETHKRNHKKETREDAQEEKCKVCKKTHLEERNKKRRHVAGDIVGDMAGKYSCKEVLCGRRNTLWGTCSPWRTHAQQGQPWKDCSPLRTHVGAEGQHEAPEEKKLKSKDWQKETFTQWPQPPVLPSTSSKELGGTECYRDQNKGSWD